MPPDLGRRGSLDSPAAAARLTLDYTPPLAVAPLATVIAAHAVPGLESVEQFVVRRPVRTSSGIATVAVRLPAASPDPVVVDVEGCPGTGLDELQQRIRRWLDLDADPASVDAALARHPVLAPLVERTPGLRVLGTMDGWETAAATVLGQQVTLAGARTLAGRLMRATAGDEPRGSAVFPSAERVAAQPVEALREAVGLTAARARTLHHLAAAVTARSVALGGDTDPEDFRRSLRQIPGIGPWTTEYLALRILGDRDACPTGDRVLQRALGVSGERQARLLTAPWSPLRAHAVFHLWTADSFAA